MYCNICGDDTPVNELVGRVVVEKQFSICEVCDLLSDNDIVNIEISNNISNKITVEDFKDNK